jgi:glycosyltransferase involved in cell wall biosynthesis
MTASDNPLISVIVPVWNAESLLPRCFDSILAQTYKNLEIILVDDGSTDGSGTICDKYAERDPRVRVIHKANGGYGTAVSAGLAIATGEYFAVPSDDDYLEPEMYEKLYECIVSNNADIAMCVETSESSNSTRTVSFVRTEKKDAAKLTPKEYFNELLENFRNNAQAAHYQHNRILRTSLLTENNLAFPANATTSQAIKIISVDCAVAASNGISFVDEILYRVIDRDNSAGRTGDPSDKKVSAAARPEDNFFAVAMLNLLPEKRDKIERIMKSSVSEGNMTLVMLAKTYKFPPRVRFTFNDMSNILKYNDDLYLKIEALVTYFCPAPIVAFAYKFYRERIAK